MIHGYKDIISLENLYLAWEEFVKDKRSKYDVIEFSIYLSKNIFDLHLDLKNKVYKHSQYESFSINDPKPRNIHKAKVRDRLLHHAIYRILYPYFDKKFIYDSYSCRNNKGTHKATKRLIEFARRESLKHSHTCWILKCDIKKFFASVDHEILYSILEKYPLDEDALGLIKEVVGSFSYKQKGKGLPLGNLTSQLLVNIYMNEFDQYMKHELKTKYYIRYADDFVILNRDKDYLLKILPKINNFLKERLDLRLHPNKVKIGTYSSGVDFLGWVHFVDHRVLRTSTKRRMFKKLSNNLDSRSLTSYFGLIKHGNTKKLERELKSLENSLNKDSKNDVLTNTYLI